MVYHSISISNRNPEIGGKRQKRVSLFNETWPKKPRECDQRLRFENEEIRLCMQLPVPLCQCVRALRLWMWYTSMLGFYRIYSHWKRTRQTHLICVYLICSKAHSICLPNSCITCVYLICVSVCAGTSSVNVVHHCYVSACVRVCLFAYICGL